MIIKETNETPFVYLSKSNCKLEIRGVSYSHGISEIYKKVLFWLDEEIKNVVDCEFVCEFNFLVINSITHKSLLKIFSRLRDYQLKKISVFWYINEGDEEMVELTEELFFLFSIPIKIINI